MSSIIDAASACELSKRNAVKIADQLKVQHREDVVKRIGEAIENGEFEVQLDYELEESTAEYLKTLGYGVYTSGYTSTYTVIKWDVRYVC